MKTYYAFYTNSDNYVWKVSLLDEGRWIACYVEMENTSIIFIPHTDLQANIVSYSQNFKDSNPLRRIASYMVNMEHTNITFIACHVEHGKYKQITYLPQTDPEARCVSAWDSPHACPLHSMVCRTAVPSPELPYTVPEVSKIIICLFTCRIGHALNLNSLRNKKSWWNHKVTLPPALSWGLIRLAASLWFHEIMLFSVLLVSIICLMSRC